MQANQRVRADKRSTAPWHRAIWLAGAVMAHGAAHAQWNIPAGSVVDLFGGATTLGCTDLRVAGTLRLSAGTVTEVRSVAILPGGSLELGGGGIELAQQWLKQGSFSAGGGTVMRVNSAACPAVGAVGPVDTSITVAVPTLGHAPLAGLAALIGVLAWRTRRRQRRTAPHSSHP